jgi:hypothetical protein
MQRAMSPVKALAPVLALVFFGCGGTTIDDTQGEAGVSCMPLEVVKSSITVCHLAESCGATSYTILCGSGASGNFVCSCEVSGKTASTVEVGGLSCQDDASQFFKSCAFP